MLNPLFTVLHLVLWSCIIKESRLNKPLGVGSDQRSSMVSASVTVSTAVSALVSSMMDCEQCLKSNEPFPLQAVFGYDAYHSNRKQIRTPNKLYALNHSLESMVEGEN